VERVPRRQAGAIAGEKTARRFGWKIGDRIPIKDSPYGPYWEFNSGRHL
jgi:hypothetical protein